MKCNTSSLKGKVSVVAAPLPGFPSHKALTLLRISGLERDCFMLDSVAIFKTPIHRLDHQTATVRPENDFENGEHLKFLSRYLKLQLFMHTMLDQLRDR